MLNFYYGPCLKNKHPNTNFIYITRGFLRNTDNYYLACKLKVLISTCLLVVQKSAVITVFYS